jgi:superkiller protein 3
MRPLAWKKIIVPLGIPIVVVLAFFGFVRYSFSAGRAAVEQSRYADAERYFGRIVRLAPWSGQYHAWFGYALMKQQKWDAALAHYTVAIRRGYAYSSVWQNRGYVYRAKAIAAGIQNEQDAQRQYAELSIADYEKAVENNPRSAQSYFYLGNVHYYHLQEYEKALGFYQKALELEPTNWRYWTGVAAGYAGIGDYERALGYLERSLDIKPTPQAYNSIGWIYGYRLNDYPKAIEAFERAIALDPAYANVYDNLGGIYFRLGENEKALDAYNTYLRLAPEGEWAEFVRSQIQKLQSQ